MDDLLSSQDRDEGGLFDPVADVADGGGEAVRDEPPRLAAVRRAVGSWTDQLVDRSARNALLFYRDLKAGTLDLTLAPPHRVFALLGGRPSTVDGLASDASDAADVLRRTRTIHKKAQTLFEERGIQTLYVAVGLATWENQHGAARPAAPILLAPAELRPRGAAQQSFELETTADLEVNPTLVSALQTEFDVALDPDELLAHADIEGAIDTQAELDVVFAWLRTRCATVPGFDVRPKVALGTFSYAKLPMVQDLKASVEALAEHDLIAALAGDAAAREELRERRVEVEPSAPDHTPPADEFLVLDADSTQSLAINKVLAGQDLVVKGPPGTGKSQTITNLIATLVARGRSVLFVAEKRAAIDAVLGRLEDDRVGLGDLVLDLHGGATSKRLIAQSLAAALDGNAAIPRVDSSGTDRILAGRRRELGDWADAVWEDRAPWGTSLLAVQTRRLELGPDAETEHRVRGGRLHALTPEALAAVREELRSFVAIGGLRDHADAPWLASLITTQQEVERARDLVDALALGEFDDTVAELEAAARETGIPPAGRLEDWPTRLAAWEDAKRTLGRFAPAVFDADLETMAVELGPLGRGAGARLAAAIGNPRYRAARKQANALQIDGPLLQKAALLAAVQDAAACRATWSALGAGGAPRSPAGHERLRARWDTLHGSLDALGALLGAPCDTGPQAELGARVRALRADVATLGRLPELQRLRTRLEAAGFAPLLGELATWRPDPEGAVAALDFCVAASIEDEIRLVDPRVAAFDGRAHEQVASEFRQADRRHISDTARRVRRLAAERARAVGDEHPDQAALVRKEAAKRTRHIPLRQLFAEAPEALTAIKPCWVMSPLVVSHVLPNDRPYFDVVIFDEASQVRPAEAIPAIARGRRLVVAGDEHQLPPTDFFTGPLLASDDDAEDDALAATSTDFESILDALLFLVGWEMLAWHYRSADERLIAFSNAHLYGGAMLTFPGIAGAETLEHVLVPWRPGQPGIDDSATAEVHRVVEIVLAHAEERPHESLGVIAMGIKHAGRIDAVLRDALQARPDLEEFFADDARERFFVKNLERVQGDERDAIVLTTGYTKNEEGRMRYAFGPLNLDGGERRLNVAVTRARRRMTIVSSFAAADMDPERTRRGGDLLRRYLDYVQSRGARLGRQDPEAPELNAFELDIRDALTRAGIPVVCQHGVGGYRLDFAAQHPEQRGRFVLAVEADGAAYHSSATARDRDRLRQQQLERLGWRFHRIWSQDWFRDRERELARVVEAYRDAVRRADEPEGDGPADDEPPVSAPVAALPERGPRPPLPQLGQIDAYAEAQLDALVRWIESDTLLRSRDEVIDEAWRSLGFTRRGRRIVERLGAAVDRTRRADRPWDAPRSVGS
jgi:very-short-patch-repair endonuclease